LAMLSVLPFFRGIACRLVVTNGSVISLRRVGSMLAILMVLLIGWIESSGRIARFLARCYGYSI
jgi:hypothetical protein